MASQEIESKAIASISANLKVRCGTENSRHVFHERYVIHTEMLRHEGIFLYWSYSDRSCFDVLSRSSSHFPIKSLARAAKLNGLFQLPASTLATVMPSLFPIDKLVQG